MAFNALWWTFLYFKGFCRTIWIFFSYPLVFYNFINFICFLSSWKYFNWRKLYIFSVIFLHNFIYLVFVLYFVIKIFFIFWCLTLVCSFIELYCFIKFLCHSILKWYIVMSTSIRWIIWLFIFLIIWIHWWFVLMALTILRCYKIIIILIIFFDISTLQGLLDFILIYNIIINFNVLFINLLLIFFINKINRNYFI